jgi:hypothetical protein
LHQSLRFSDGVTLLALPQECLNEVLGTWLLQQIAGNRAGAKAVPEGSIAAFLLGSGLSRVLTLPTRTRKSGSGKKIRTG